MWCLHNEIESNYLKSKAFLLIKYKCVICFTSTAVHFTGFHLGFFSNKPNYVWDTEIECDKCGCVHRIDVKYFRNTIVVSAESADETLRVDTKNLSFSLNESDILPATTEVSLDLDWIESIIGNDSYSNYLAAVQEIRELLKIPEVNREEFLLKLFYSNIISIFETYLSDLMINAVNSDTRTLRKVVEDYKIFDKEKIEKVDLFKALDSIKDVTIKELQKLIYHNLSVIIPLYKNALEIDFSNLTDGLRDVINVRHDIVHRNGRDWLGKSHMFTLESINEVLDLTNRIVDFINGEFEKKGIAIEKKQKKEHMDDLPF